MRAKRQGEAKARTFLVEHYWPGVTARAFARAAEGVRTSAEELAREGVNVEFLHSTLVPEDEAAFCVLLAESEAIVEEAYRRAGVRFDRMRGAVEVGADAADASADERSTRTRRRPEPASVERGREDPCSEGDG